MGLQRSVTFNLFPHKTVSGQCRAYNPLIKGADIFVVEKILHGHNNN